MLPTTSTAEKVKSTLELFLQSNQRRLLAKDIMMISEEMDTLTEQMPESATKGQATSNAASSTATLNNLDLPRTSPISNKTSKKSFPSKSLNSSWITEPDEQEHQQHLPFPFREDQSVIYDLEVKMEKLKQEIDDSKQENSQLHKAKKELLRRVDELEKKFDHLQNDNAILMKDNANYKKNLEKTKARITEMKAVLKDTEEKIHSQNEDISSRDLEINKQHKLQNLVQSENDKLYSDFVALSESYSKLQEANLAISEDLHNISLDNQILKEQIETHQREEQEPEQFEVHHGTGEILGDILNDPIRQEIVRHGKGIQCSEVYDEQIKMLLNLVDDIDGYIVNIKKSSTLQSFKEVDSTASNSDSVETVLSKLHHIKNNVSIISMEVPEIIPDPDISMALNFPQPNLIRDELLLEATLNPSPELSTPDMLLTLPNLPTPPLASTKFEIDKESYEKTRFTRPVLRTSHPKNMFGGVHFVLLIIGILIGFTLNGWNREVDEFEEDYGYSFLRETFVDGVTPM